MAELTLDTHVIDAVLPDLIGHDRRPAAFAVYLCLLRRAAAPTWGVRMSHQALSHATGLSRSAVQSALAHLNRRQLVVSHRAHATAMPVHTVARPWARRAARERG